MRAIIPKSDDGKYKGTFNIFGFPYRITIGRGAVVDGKDTLVIEYEPETKAEAKT